MPALHIREIDQGNLVPFVGQTYPRMAKSAIDSVPAKLACSAKRLAITPYWRRDYFRNIGDMHASIDVWNISNIYPNSETVIFICLHIVT